MIKNICDTFPSVGYNYEIARQAGDSTLPDNEAVTQEIPRTLLR